MVRDQGHGVGDIGARDELAVRLVGDHDAVGGDRVEEADECFGVHRGAGRVVRVREEHELRPARHGVGDRVEVQRLTAQRHCDRRPSGDLGEDRVRLERRSAEDNFVAGIDVGERELGQQADRAATDRDVRRLDPEVLGDRLAELDRAVIRIPIDVRGRGFDRPDDRRQWPVGALVGREPDRVVERVHPHGRLGRPTRLVGA